MRKASPSGLLASPLYRDLEGKSKLLVKDSRNLDERDIKNDSIHLVVTSPPYPKVRLWDPMFLSLGINTFEKSHDYLEQVWRQCYRVLVDGGILCVNIGDATRTVSAEELGYESQEPMFRLFPNHALVMDRCEEVGFEALPYILWKKPTTRPKYKGKTVYLGSGFLPPNAYVTQDVEYILIFRKGGRRKFDPGDRRRLESQYTKPQRDKWFSQIWTGITGARQTIGDSERRIAAFPEEIPSRLIQMFSVKGDTVFDPFLGSGTTMKVAAELDRYCIGVEVDETLFLTILHRIGYFDESSGIRRQGVELPTEMISRFHLELDRGLR